MDIILDNDYIPVIKDGDFVVDDSLQQQQKLLLVLNKGELKEFPLIGCGVINSINDENPENIIKEIKRQFKADGLTINSITVDNEIKIDAQRS